MIVRGERRRRNRQCLQPEGEYNKLRAQGWQPAGSRLRNKTNFTAVAEKSDMGLTFRSLRKNRPARIGNRAEAWRRAKFCVLFEFGFENHSCRDSC
jgi:hypothetical protein